MSNHEDNKKKHEDGKENSSENNMERLILDSALYKYPEQSDKVSKKLNEIQEEVRDLDEKRRILKAKINRLQGEQEECIATFWMGARAEHRDWFRFVSENGLHVHLEKVTDPDTKAFVGYKIIAHANDQAVIANVFRQLFNPRDSDE